MTLKLRGPQREQFLVWTTTLKSPNLEYTKSPVGQQSVNSELLKLQHDMMSQQQTMAYGWKIKYCNSVQRIQRLRSTLFWTFQWPFSTPPMGHEKNIMAFPTPTTPSNGLPTATSGLGALNIKPLVYAFTWKVTNVMFAAMYKVETRENSIKRQTSLCQQ